MVRIQYAKNTNNSLWYPHTGLGPAPSGSSLAWPMPGASLDGRSDLMKMEENTEKHTVCLECQGYLATIETKMESTMVFRV